MLMVVAFVEDTVPNKVMLDNDHVVITRVDKEIYVNSGHVMKKWLSENSYSR